MKIIGIFARDESNVIGYSDGNLPWETIAEDLDHFKSVTLGNAVLMGRKTWKSLPQMPLLGRFNIVLSENADYNPKDEMSVQDTNRAAKTHTFLHKADSIKMGIELAESKGYSKLFIIGGAEIYDQTFHLWDECYETKVNNGYEIKAKRKPIQEGFVTNPVYITLFTKQFDPSKWRLKNKRVLQWGSINHWVLHTKESQSNAPTKNEDQLKQSLSIENAPSHYTNGGKAIDVVEYMRQHGITDFHTGNSLKYLTRAGKKTNVNAKEDYFKAMNYIHHKLTGTWLDKSKFL